VRGPCAAGPPRDAIRSEEHTLNFSLVAYF